MNHGSAYAYADGSGACGGDGLPFDVTGETVWYGGGGGAGGSTSYYARGFGGKGGGGDGACIPNANTSRIAGWPGANGLGGGGGGGGRDNGFGAAGGSGIVVIRYLLAPPGTMILVR